jgi:hypothetical protein
VAIDLDVRRSRRTLLAAIAGAASGAVAATFSRAQRALAATDDGTPIAVGYAYVSHRTTALVNNYNDITPFSASSEHGGTGVWAESVAGSGVFASSVSGSGLVARSKTGTGVHGISNFTGGTSETFPAAVVGEVDLKASVSILGNNYATSGLAQGVQGTTDSPKGLATTGWARKNGIGVVGVSGASFPSVPARTGVYGKAPNGRGVVASGGVAQLRLVPSTAANHPASGAVGDLFLDKSHRLWFCKGGTVWKQIA